MWKGTIEGEDTTKHWTGEVSLDVETSGGVRGSIKWKSDAGHDGIDYVEGTINGAALELKSTRASNHVSKPRIVKCVYQGMLAADGRINLQWSSQHTGPKGRASGKLTNQG